MNSQNDHSPSADADDSEKHKGEAQSKDELASLSSPNLACDELLKLSQSETLKPKAYTIKESAAESRQPDAGGDRQIFNISRSLAAPSNAHLNDRGLSIIKDFRLGRKDNSDQTNPNPGELSFQKTNMSLFNSSEKLSQRNFLGIPMPFQIAKKSEFKREFTEDEERNMQLSINNFLADTAPKEVEELSEAEKHELVEKRRAIEQSKDPSVILSNALHLARLYQHLRYIDDAKKAAQLALAIDPENTLGKQLFEELERMHPVDRGPTFLAAPSSQPLIRKSNLRKRILEFNRGRIIVLGDLLIDELIEGKPERISREAPVLILEHADTELICGGAANTAHNVTALGGSCHAIGVCGQDEYAPKLAQILESSGITHSLVEDRTRPTTVKTRILSKNHAQLQQLLRIDRISHEKTTPEISNLLVEKLQSAAANYQAVILSDYRAGVITDLVIEGCRSVAQFNQMAVVVDAQESFERFKGFTLMTPNQPDTEQAVGFPIDNKDDLQRAGEKILKETGIEALLVTRGAAGMALFQAGLEMVELPAFNRSDVFDVSGAGDTVVATMCLALVTGATFIEAMALGNLAAGIVVRKAGTAVTNQRELLQNLEALAIPE